MAEFSEIADEPRRGMLAQTVTTLFVGIPMTIGLGVALGFYVLFEFARFKLSSLTAKKQSLSEVENADAASQGQPGPRD